jgi:flavin-dependent dehydrogenase
LTCDFFVEARGVSTIIKNNRTGVLQSAQYEVYAEWIKRDTIEVAFDNAKYPGFFAWVIPTGEGCGKVGVAGRAINAADTLQRYIDGKGKSSIVRKVYAPIWVQGPIDTFVTRHTVVVGDAAGQSKPTTAGGIYTCGMGGILAGRAIAKSIDGGSDKLLGNYSKQWFSKFEAEFEKMLLARKLLERLDNKALDEIVSAVSPDKLEEVSRTGDFDFHSSALAKILSTKSAAKFAKALLGNELRRLFDIKQDINSV